MTGLQMVLDNIRPSFEYNVLFVEKFLTGSGFDMGCGNCPLLKDDCLHVDQAPQPLAVEQVGVDRVIKVDAVTFDLAYKVDYIFSSHMVEDLPSKQDMINCLRHWAKYINIGGHLVLLLPDMLGGRYATVEEGGNPSHRINVGVPFITEILPELSELELVQIDTIPHNKSCTLDVVFKRT